MTLNLSFVRYRKKTNGYRDSRAFGELGEKGEGITLALTQQSLARKEQHSTGNVVSNIVTTV